MPSKKSQDRPSCTLIDVAARARVSLSTASRALNGKDNVTPETRRRVVRAASELGYMPNAGARALRMQRTMTLGAVLQDLVSTVQVELFNGLTSEADAQGYTLLVTNAGNDRDAYARLMRRLVEHRVDGLILHSPGGVATEAARYRALGIPVLATNGREEDCPEIPLVAPAGRDAARAAIRDLYELGHRTVGFVGSALGRNSLIVEALRTEARTAGVEWVDTEMRHGSDENLLAALGVSRLLASKKPPSALFCLYRSSHAVLAEVRELGLTVPDDLSICSVSDDPRIDALMRPRLAALHINAREVGRRTIRAILELIGGAAPENIREVNVTTWMPNETLGPAPAETGMVHVGTLPPRTAAG